MATLPAVLVSAVLASDAEHAQRTLVDADHMTAQEAADLLAFLMQEP